MNTHEIIKLFDIPKDIINDNERQRRVYSPQGICPTILARTDQVKILVKNNGYTQNNQSGQLFSGKF